MRNNKCTPLSLVLLSHPLAPSRAAAGDEWAPPGLRARAAAALRVKADLAAAALRRGEPAGDVARAAAAADALDLAEYLLPVLRAEVGA